MRTWKKNKKASEVNLWDECEWLFIVLLKNFQYRVSSIWLVNKSEVFLKVTSPAVNEAGQLQSHSLLSAALNS